MKKILIAAVAFIAVIWIVQHLERGREERAWVPPLPQEYPLINKMAKISHEERGGLLATLRGTGELMHITAKQADALHAELEKAVREYPEEAAVISSAAIMAQQDREEAQFHENLLELNLERQRKGEDAKEGISNQRKYVKKILHEMQRYLPPVAENALAECQTLRCEGLYIKLMLLEHMAYLLEKTGKTEEAEEYLNTAIDNLDSLEKNEKDEMNVELYTQLGLFKLSQKEPDEAAEALKRSEPSRVTFDILLNGWDSELAERLFDAGRREAALEYWEDAVTFWKTQIGKAENDEQARLMRKRLRGAEELLDEMRKKAESAKE